MTKNALTTSYLRKIQRNCLLILEFPHVHTLLAIPCIQHKHGEELIHIEKIRGNELVGNFSLLSEIWFGGKREGGREEEMITGKENQAFWRKTITKTHHRMEKHYCFFLSWYSCTEAMRSSSIHTGEEIRRRYLSRIHIEPDAPRVIRPVRTSIQQSSPDQNSSNLSQSKNNISSSKFRTGRSASQGVRPTSLESQQIGRQQHTEIIRAIPRQHLEFLEDGMSEFADGFRPSSSYSSEDLAKWDHLSKTYLIWSTNLRSRELPPFLVTNILFRNFTITQDVWHRITHLWWSCSLPQRENNIQTEICTSMEIR